MNTFESVFAPQKEFFQDDVFPDTAVWWEASLTAAAWLSGSNGKHRKISLRPKDMTPGTAQHPQKKLKEYLSKHLLYACSVTQYPS